MRSDNENKLPRSFKNLTNLERLDLSQTGLTSYPDGIDENKKLTSLVLKSNEIILDEHIKPNPYIESLDLTRNKIHHLPSQMSGFTNLKKLLLNFNRIESVDAGISQLKNLEELSFYRNNPNCRA
jgi:Leucine-rich repeat (LRR) protein